MGDAMVYPERSVPERRFTGVSGRLPRTEAHWAIESIHLENGRVEQQFAMRRLLRAGSHATRVAAIDGFSSIASSVFALPGMLMRNSVIIG